MDHPPQYRRPSTLLELAWQHGQTGSVSTQYLAEPHRKLPVWLVRETSVASRKCRSRCSGPLSSVRSPARWAALGHPKNDRDLGPVRAGTRLGLAKYRYGTRPVLDYVRAPASGHLLYLGLQLPIRATSDTATDVPRPIWEEHEHRGAGR